MGRRSSSAVIGLLLCLASPALAQQPAAPKQVGSERGRAELTRAFNLLITDSLDQAIPHFRIVIEEEKGNADGVAKIIYNDATLRGVRQENWPYAVRGLAAAKMFVVDPALRREFDFWHGWSIYQSAAQLEVAQTVESATLTRPMFLEAKSLLESGQDYAERSHFSMSGIMTRVDGYIEMESRILDR